MRARVCKVLVLFAVGSVANVIVAWLIVMFVPIDYNRESTFKPVATPKELVAHTPYAQWTDLLECDEPFHCNAGVGVIAEVWILQPQPHDSGFTLVGADGKSTTYDSLTDLPVARIRAGWPIPSMIGSFIYGVCRFDHPPLVYQYAIPLPERLQPHDGFNWELGGKRPLPLMPLSIGFVIDSLFYASALCGFLFGFKAIKSNRRRRLGLCISCGYPVGSSPVCTECGHPMPDQRINPA